MSSQSSRRTKSQILDGIKKLDSDWEVTRTWLNSADVATRPGTAAYKMTQRDTYERRRRELESKLETAPDRTSRTSKRTSRPRTAADAETELSTLKTDFDTRKADLRSRIKTESKTDDLREELVKLCTAYTGRKDALTQEVADLRAAQPQKSEEQADDWLAKPTIPRARRGGH